MPDAPARDSGERRAAARGRKPGQAFSGARRNIRPRDRAGSRGGRCVVHAARARDARDRRRVRLRKIHARPHDRAADRSDRRDHPSARHRYLDALGRRHAALPARHPVRVSGPVCVAQSAAARRRDRGRGDREFRNRDGRGRQPARGGAVRARRPAAGADAQLSARILRRPAPAARHRAGARPQPEHHRGGRAGLGARRVGAGAGDQPDDRPAAGIRHRLPFHRARSRGRAAHQPSRRRHVSRPHRRDRAARRAVHRAAASLHRGAARLRSDPRSRAAARQGRAVGRSAEPDAPAARLPLPYALPAGAGALPDRGARDGRDRARIISSPATCAHPRRPLSRPTRTHHEHDADQECRLGDRLGRKRKASRLPQGHRRRLRR